MDKVAEYRECAGECLRLAASVEKPEDRALLVTMAERWGKLAASAERRVARPKITGLQSSDQRQGRRSARQQSRDALASS